MLTFLAAWPPVAECRFCVPGYNFASRAASLHASPRGGLPPTTLRSGCPATARLAARFNRYVAGQSAANTEPLFRFAAQMLNESHAAKPQNESKPCPSLRDRELINLELDDIIEERGLLLVREGKGKKDRMVPIGQRALG